MKKLLFIFAFLGFAVAGFSQTIEDHGVFVRIDYSGGPRIDIPKDNPIIYIDDNGNRVYIKSRSYNTRSLDYDEFGFASDSALQDYLSAIFYGKYYETYINVTGTTQIDTAKYWYISATDTTAQFYINYDYTGASSDTLASKTILPQ